MLTASTTSTTIVVLAATLLAALTNLQHIDACSCAPSSVYEDYTRYYSIFRVKVLKKLKSAKECQRDEAVSCEETYWIVKLKKHFGPGCPPSKKFILSTPTECCLCGYFPDVKKDYLIFGSETSVTVRGMAAYSVNSCSSNAQWSSVSAAERKFLEGRSIDCDGEISCAKRGRTKRFEDDTCAAAEPCPDNCPMGPMDEFGDPEWTIECIPTSVCEKCGAVPLLYNFSYMFDYSADGPKFIDGC